MSVKVVVVVDIEGVAERGQSSSADGVEIVGLIRADSSLHGVDEKAAHSGSSLIAIHAWKSRLPLVGQIHVSQPVGQIRRIGIHRLCFFLWVLF